MSSSNRRGRRVPPKARGARPASTSGPAPGAGVDGEPGAPGYTAPTERVGTRAANRAAKRASGVRVKGSARSRGGARRSRSSNTALIALGIGAAVIVAAVVLLGNPFGTPAASPTAASTAGASQGAVQSHGDGTCPTSQPASLAAGDTRTVTIETAKGNIVIRVDGSRAPIATGNFVALAGCHFYDGIVFHRLVPGFVIQGGDPDGTGGGGPGYAIKDDPLIGTYRRGTVAMARTAQPDTQGSQFFIVLSDDAAGALTDPSVPYPYAILGEVTAGMDVVDAIAAMPNGGPPDNAALEPVAMTKVTVSAGPASSPSPAATPAATSGPSPATTP